MHLKKILITGSTKLEPQLDKSLLGKHQYNSSHDSYVDPYTDSEIINYCILKWHPSHSLCQLFVKQFAHVLMPVFASTFLCGRALSMYSQSLFDIHLNSMLMVGSTRLEKLSLQDSVSKASVQQLTLTLIYRSHRARMLQIVRWFDYCFLKWRQFRLINVWLVASSSLILKFKLLTRGTWVYYHYQGKVYLFIYFIFINRIFGS
jgi:hypothetical protein